MIDDSTSISFFLDIVQKNRHTVEAVCVEQVEEESTESDNLFLYH